MENDPVSAISIEKSMPEWLISRWIPRFGVSETLLLCDVINTIPPLTLRVNTLKTTRSALLESGANMHTRAWSRPSMVRMASGSRIIRKMPVDSMEGFREDFFRCRTKRPSLSRCFWAPGPQEKP